MGRRGGSLQSRCSRTLKLSGIFQPGESRREDKDQVMEQYRSEGNAATSQDLGRETAVHSYGHMDAVTSTVKDFAKFIQENFGIRDPMALTGEHAQAYLENKIEQGVRNSSIQQYASRLAKFENAREILAEKTGTEIESIRVGIRIGRDLAHEHAEHSLLHDTRAYADPELVISAMEDSVYQIVAQIQLYGGCRVSEVDKLSSYHLRGESLRPVTGEPGGKIQVKGKGGYKRDVWLRFSTYTVLREYVEQRGKLIFDEDKYREEISKACALTNQTYTGSHSFRHNYVQDRNSQLVPHQNPTGANRQTMEEVGHHRLEEQQTYQR